MTRLSRKFLLNITSQTLARSMSVGLLGTTIDLIVFTILHITLGLPALLTNSLSYTIGSLNSFSLHRIWTFAGRPQKSFRVQFIQFLLVSSLALAINNLAMMVFTPYFNIMVDDVSYAGLAAKLCATSLGMIWNYTANNRWTFSKAIL
jgi:putative flippase GtrA